MNAAFYVSGHGLGHSVRSIEVIRALLGIVPGAGVTASTWADRWLYEKSLPGLRVRYCKTDVGLVQLDNLRFDLPATLDELESVRQHAEKMMEREAAFLKESRADVVVSDVPFLPLAAAESLGIPSVILTNFTWDWIYSFYEGFEDISRWIASFYSTASLTLRLPFHGGMDMLPNVVDLPLVARKSKLTKDEARERAGLPKDRPVFLVSFTALGLKEGALERLAKLDEYLFVFKGPLDISAPNFRESEADFTELLRAANGVITKPGYGVVSECIANETPMLYTQRGEFAEYPKLVEGIGRCLKNAYIPQDKLLDGEWGPYLEALLNAREPMEKMPAHGAKVAARKMAELAGG